MIFIQSRIINDQFVPHHFDAACAMYGAIETGQEFKFVDYNYLIQGAYDKSLKNNLFVGSVEFMQEVFKRAGANPYNFLIENKPGSVIPMPLSKAKAFVRNGVPLFIKPSPGNMKKFSGMVFRDEMDLSSIKDLPPDFMVWTTEPFRNTIVTEWRVYIHNGDVVGIKNYSGEHYYQPNHVIIDKYMRRIINPPVAYCIDIAMALIAGDSDTKSELVEFTDMWAVGNYGVENDVYLKMLKDRYFEIMGK